MAALNAASLRMLVPIVGVVGASALLGRYIPALPVQTLIGWTVSGLLVITALVRPFAGLMFLTAAMLLAPEIVMGEAGARDITVRMDDLFVVCLAIGWLGHCAVIREAPLFPGTPFTRPMGWYLAIGIVTSCRAMMLEWVDPLKSMFFLAKFAEYFLLMFLTLAIVRTTRQAQVLLVCGLLTAVVVAWFGWGMKFRGEIVGTPFQRAGAEGATYGAYMILAMGLIAGVLLESGLRVKLIGGALLAVMFPPFMYTSSRASYMGLAVSSLVMLLTARRGRVWIAPLIAVGTYMMVVHPPKQIKEKMESTFVGKSGTFFGHDVSADESVYERLWRYEMALKMWTKHPILGNGVGGAAVEGIYINELSQMGVVGLGAFLLIAWRILQLGWQVRSGPHPPWVRGLGQGLVVGYAGLLAHALTANTFHLIRVMEPLMLTIGLLLILQRQAAPIASAVPGLSLPTAQTRAA